MNPIFRHVLLVSSLIFASSASANSFEGAPTGTEPIEFEVTHSDSEFLGEIMVGKRIFGSESELILRVRVRGFGLIFKAGVDGIFQTAEEISYYHPEWSGEAISSLPSFVWWESDETTSTHIFKIPFHSESTSAAKRQMRLSYVNDETSNLVIDFK
jgi:hypothetical protein